MVRALLLVTVFIVASLGAVYVYTPQTHCGAVSSASWNFRDSTFAFTIQNGTNVWSYSGTDTTVVFQLEGQPLSVCVTSSGPGTTIKVVRMDTVSDRIIVAISAVGCASSTTLTFVGRIMNTYNSAWVVTLHFRAVNSATGTVDIDTVLNKTYLLGPDSDLEVAETLALWSGAWTCDISNYQLGSGAYLATANPA